MPSTVRLCVDHALSSEACVPLSPDQAHYLFGVMRLTEGDEVRLFNSADGEWRARVASVSRRDGSLLCEAQTAPLHRPPDVWLLFAPLKKQRTDFVVEKATELGIGRIKPVNTDRTNSERVKRTRLQSHAVEAAEQCGGTFVPLVDDLSPLDRILDDWPQDRRLMFCDEELAGGDGAARLPEHDGPWGILIGPEGGFSDAERRRLGDMAQSVAVRLGPRILRADTAAVAAMTLWQQARGDW